MFMDRSHLLANGKPTLDKFQLSLFHDIVFENSELQPLILTGTLEYMQLLEEVTGHQDLLHKAIALFHNIGVYQTVFEPRLLAQLQELSYNWSKEETLKMNVPNYIKTAIGIMERAIKTGQDVGLDSSTRTSIMTMMEHIFIGRQQAYLSLCPYP